MQYSSYCCILQVRALFLMTTTTRSVDDKAWKICLQGNGPRTQETNTIFLQNTSNSRSTLEMDLTDAQKCPITRFSQRLANPPRRAGLQRMRGFLGIWDASQKAGNRLDKCLLLPTLTLLQPLITEIAAAQSLQFGPIKELVHCVEDPSAQTRVIQA